jgi:hypothetical protein
MLSWGEFDIRMRLESFSKADFDPIPDYRALRR